MLDSITSKKLTDAGFLKATDYVWKSRTGPNNKEATEIVELGDNKDLTTVSSAPLFEELAEEINDGLTLSCELVDNKLVWTAVKGIYGGVGDSCVQALAELWLIINK